jgi:hypothetical protein
MTPLQIQMMLHYYAIAEPYACRQPEHAHSGATKDQRLQLIAWDLLEFTPDKPSSYTPTEKGVAYVQALCDMPLPIKKWVMPDAA